MTRPVLLTTAEMRSADALTIAAGTPGYELMRRAGAAVADIGREMVAPGGRVLVLCGPGNNGGDGFVAARLLRNQELDVEVALFGESEALTGDAGLAFADWGGPAGDAGTADPQRADVIIDALFGAGLSRDLDGDARRIVERINDGHRRVLAVDVPSGLDGDTGQVRGVAVRATRTVTFARRKPGHLLFPGRALCGPVTVADIGITDETITAVAGATFANGPELWRGAFPQPSSDGHKYDRGHALVLSGGPMHTGAARLAAKAALRAGAGLVTVATGEFAIPIHAAHLTAIMLRQCNGAADLDAILQDRRFNAVALGPALGVSAATRDAVAVALRSGRAVVLDADALTSFEGTATNLAGEGRERPAWPVLTPHDGEFARLFGGQPEIIDAPSKLQRAGCGAALVDGVLVLKGSDTVIAAPDGRAAINENGTPYLATAGSGDVLTGIIAGLLAQGMPPFEAACAGVWLHAEAGRRFGPGLIAEDLPEALPGVLRFLLDKTPGSSPGIT